MSGHEFRLAIEGMTALEGAWNYLRVVRFDGAEAMNRLFRYEIVALIKGDDCDPEIWIGKRASLRIATLSEPPFRLIHGIITEAEDAGMDANGPLYRLVLEPSLAAARYRVRNRIFLDKTPRQIIESVLRDDTGMSLVPATFLDMPLGGPLYKPAADRFTWRIAASPRLDDPKARPYVVQYGESDLNFVSRILEEEGVGFHFEQNDEVSLLVLSDKDFGRPRVPINDTFGPGKIGRAIGTFRMVGRLRAQSVSLGEYNWEKPALDIGVKVQLGDSLGLSQYSFPGGYHEGVEQGKPLAMAQAEALHTESSFATGEGSTRLLAAGAIFTLEHPKTRLEGEYVVTALRAYAYQQGVLASEAAATATEPFRIEIECACRGRGTKVSESLFRPARLTPKPRIFGTQTAFVTAESNSNAEINIGGPSGIGCVRVAFPWDTDKTRQSKESSSTWIRVNEPMARGGQGGIWHPRVGTEVIVEYEEGDPDRPVITGRVYNGKNRPAQTTATHSTMWSLSTPGAGVRNEITFEDTAGKERVYTNAGKDMTTNVGNHRVENVGANAFMHVGSDNAEDIALNQTVDIGANDSLDVAGNQDETIDANQLRIIGTNRTMIIGGNETRTTGSNHANLVGGPLSEVVLGTVTETYGAIRTTRVAADCTETFDSTRDQKAFALAFQDYGGMQKTTVNGTREIRVGAMLGQFVMGDVTTTITETDTMTAGAAIIHIAGGGHNHTSPKLTINSPLKLHLTGYSSNTFPMKLTFAGLSMGVTGFSLGYRALNATHTSFSFSNTGVDISNKGLELFSSGNVLTAYGVIIYPAGMHTKT
jgi:type VI secretion system secreted protein VgrG